MIETGDTSLISAGFRMLWGLLIVLGIILVIYGIMRKKFSFIQANSKSEIKIIEIRHLMQKKSICLVEVQGQRFLLGLGQENITLLSAITDNEKTTFTATLASAADQHEQQSS